MQPQVAPEQAHRVARRALHIRVVLLYTSFLPVVLRRTLEPLDAHSGLQLQVQLAAQPVDIKLAGGV